MLSYDSNTTWIVSNRTFANISAGRYENVYLANGGAGGWSYFNGSVFSYISTADIQTFITAIVAFDNTPTMSASKIPSIGLTCIGTNGTRVYQFYNYNAT